ncbi:hypothetical protein [Microbacterium sp. zg.Y909]|uniref:hypothetical protein n=1 Tax=Microbacterium sp. zg.Y909 TaxID=2969413 RepID=UPI00214AA9E5|nr:hypothetical protein [Microbacterium sp. zg.Y909]MCR2827315.1 hypothetical protein [Microbacterium sp. zg.Y909]
MTLTAPRTHASAPPVEPSSASRPWLVPAIVLVAAAICWAVALPGLRDAPWNLFGLLAASGPLFPVSIVLATVAFCLAIALRTHRTAGAALVSTVLMMRLPTAVSTDAPLYSWTYKHFGPTDYIQRFGVVDVDVDIYHNWPGAFSFIAWLNTVTGVETISVAQWFTVGSQLAVTAAVFFLARTYGMGTPTALVAAFGAHTANWVAQDYLSPQAIGFALAIVVMALLLASGTTKAAAWVAVPIFAAIVVTHQLTPYWLLAALFVLTLLGRVKPKYIFLVFAAIAIGYMLLHLNVLSQFGRLLNFDFLSNILTPSARNETLGNPSLGQVVSSWSARAVTLLLWVSAGIVTVVRLVRRRDQWRDALVPAVVAFSPGLILVAQGYGGEALFRVFLYSIPGCMLILAPGLTRMLRGEAARARRTAQAGAAVIASIAGLLSMQAYYGGWFANLVTPESVRLTTDILQNEDPATLTIGVAPGAPGRLVAEYVDFVQANQQFDSGIDMWLTSWPGWENEQFADPRRVTRLTDSLVWEQRPALVVITQQMRDYSTYYGTLPDGALGRFENILEDDPRWELAHESDETLVYRLNLGVTPQG